MASDDTKMVEPCAVHNGGIRSGCPPKVFILLLNGHT